MAGPSRRRRVAGSAELGRPDSAAASGPEPVAGAPGPERMAGTPAAMARPPSLPGRPVVPAVSAEPGRLAGPQRRPALERRQPLSGRKPVPELRPQPLRRTALPGRDLLLAARLQLSALELRPVPAAGLLGSGLLAGRLQRLRPALSASGRGLGPLRTGRPPDRPVLGRGRRRDLRHILLILADDALRGPGRHPPGPSAFPGCRPGAPP